jgi:hypothetical protein
MHIKKSTECMQARYWGEAHWKAHKADCNRRWSVEVAAEKSI